LKGGKAGIPADFAGEHLGKQVQVEETAKNAVKMHLEMQFGSGSESR
jgi:hypothetical protein